MVKNKRILTVVLILFLVAVAASGCSSTSEEEERVEASGTPKVESMLLAFNDGDFEAFVQDFGPVMTEAVTEEVFLDGLKPAIGEIIGDYEEGSLSLAKVTKENYEEVDYLVAIYRSTFTDEDGDVTVTIWFTDDEEMKIETLYFNSPKLVEANS